MSQEKRLLKAKLMQARKAYKLAQEQEQEAYKKRENTENLLSNEVKNFAPCKGCYQTITEEDNLVWLGHWYWKSTTLGLDQDTKYCKYFDTSADDLPKQCQGCDYAWIYKNYINSDHAWSHTLKELEETESKYMFARQELYDYKIQKLNSFIPGLGDKVIKLKPKKTGVAKKHKSNLGLVWIIIGILILLSSPICGYKAERLYIKNNKKEIPLTTSRDEYYSVRKYNNKIAQNGLYVFGGISIAQMLLAVGLVGLGIKKR